MMRTPRTEFWAGARRGRRRRHLRERTMSESTTKNRHPIASHPLPLIPTATVGSHAPTGWLITAVQAIQRGEYGPADIEEVLTDAVDVAVLDQQRAGVDVLVDG